MRNIRRFQRSIIVVFMGVNTIMYTKMNHFNSTDQLFTMLVVVGITTIVLLLIPRNRKNSRSKLTLNS